MTETPTSDEESVECPEHGCGIPFPRAEEVVAHLQWDHNRPELEAERMVRQELSGGRQNAQ